MRKTGASIAGTKEAHRDCFKVRSVLEKDVTRKPNLLRMKGNVTVMD